VLLRLQPDPAFPLIAHLPSCPVDVLQRDGSFATLDSAELVPGDVVRVTRGRLPADMVLLAGEAVVDEAMLTGEVARRRRRRR
jgi:P-type E1-E2 ATPase